MLSPLYIAEIAPPARRGRLVTYQQIAIVGGMTLVYFVNWAIAAQGDDAWVLSTGWRYMLLSGTPFRPRCSCCCCLWRRKRRAGW